MKNHASNIAFAIFYQKQNIYSFNALLGALETNKDLDDIEIKFYQKKDELIDGIQKLPSTYKKIIIGISFFTTQLWEIIELVKKLRKIIDKKIILIAGGAHPSGDPEGTLRIGFDAVVIGEGEETLIDLLCHIKTDKVISSIKGIAYLGQNGEIIKTGKRALLDLDRYPPLPRKNIRFGAIEITRGCPYVCYFCQTPFILGTSPRHRSVSSICETIEYMKSKGKTDIRFITPNAFSYGSNDGYQLNLPKLEELLMKASDILKPNGRIFLGSFPSEVRPEHVIPETIELVKTYASNDNLIIGAQSGSQNILDYCHRGHTIEDVIEAVDLTINSGLIANVDFIFGLPGENENDIDLTIELIEILSKKGAKIHAHSFIPLPNTPFAKQEVKPINSRLKRVIKALNEKGIAYGDWLKQEYLAVKISRYLRSI